MRILVNTSNLRFGGAVQVAFSLICELRARSEYEYHIIVGPGIASVLDPNLFSDNFHFYYKSFGIITINNVCCIQKELDEIEKQVTPDCIITTSGPAYWRSQAPHIIGFNLPLFIYPESPYVRKLPPIRKARLCLKRELHRYFFKRDADALIVQTEDVNKRVRSFLHTDNVHTISNTYAAWFNGEYKGSQILPKRQSNVFRFLTVSSYYEHKDLEIIPRVIDALDNDIKSHVEFVLTLSQDQYRQHINYTIPSQVYLTGPVLPPEVPGLYQECDALFLPTLAECFSASYPEAMKMEKPIITTDLGFAHSICDNAALYFNPCDAHSAAYQISRLVRSKSLQQQLADKGLDRLQFFDSSSDRARKILNLAEELI